MPLNVQYLFMRHLMLDLTNGKSHMTIRGKWLCQGSNSHNASFRKPTSRDSVEMKRHGRHTAVGTTLLLFPVGTLTLEVMYED